MRTICICIGRSVGSDTLLCWDSRSRVNEIVDSAYFWAESSPYFLLCEQQSYSKMLLGKLLRDHH